MYACVTFEQATSPVKLPTRHCSICRFQTELVRVITVEERYFTVARQRRTPSYSIQSPTNPQCQAIVKLSGSFCPAVSKPHLHGHFIIRRVYRQDSRSLVKPFMQVGTYPTRHHATFEQFIFVTFHPRRMAWTFLPCSSCRHEDRTISCPI